MARLLIALLSASTAIAGSQSPTAKPTPGQLLRIDAVALDSRGNPVTDLKLGDLEVWIASYRVPIEALTLVTPAGSERDGRVIVLLLDDTVVPLALTPRVREIARRFVDRMSPADRMAIVSLNGSAMELTADRTRLLRSINDYNVRAVGFTRLDLVGEHVLDTVAALSRQLAEEASVRKTIVGIGAAWLFDTPIPPPNVGRDLRQEWTAAMRSAGFANVSVYAIEPGGVGTSRFGGSAGFAHETGGHAFVNTNDFNGAVEQVMREAGTYYVIEVADPPVQRKSDLRELDVRAVRRGITIRARRQLPGTEAPTK
jgi:VWFA-related protein